MKCSDYIEVDVRLSHDHIPVIIHDARLDRTTSGTGQVNDWSVHELKGLDAGDGERIPTLHEMLNEVLPAGKGLVIEIKEQGSEDLVCSEIRNYFPENIIVVSFHRESLEVVRSSLPAIKTGIVIPNTREKPGFVDSAWFEFDCILPRQDYFTRELTEKAHHSGLQVIPWTLNKPADIRKAFRIGVEGFVTDDPCQARQVVRSVGH